MEVEAHYQNLPKPIQHLVDEAEILVKVARVFAYQSKATKEIFLDKNAGHRLDLIDPDLIARIIFKLTFEDSFETWSIFYDQTGKQVAKTLILPIER